MGVMCPGRKFWSAVQVLWSTLYVICGGAQLIAGIFFMISIPTLHLTSNLWAGSWNVIIGIIGGILSCFGQLSPRRQEFLLYMAVSILTVNSVHVILSEWGLYYADMPNILKDHPNHILIDCACFATRISTAIVILASFLDSQLSFCSMQIAPSHQEKKKIRGSHEQVSDIEYIIPRPKQPKPQTALNAYSQSWVFDADAAGTSNHVDTSTTYVKVVQNGTPKNKSKKTNGMHNGISDVTHLIDNPVVHIEEASDDSTSNSDRKLCHMKSFSRSTSPAVLSAASSQVSLNINQNIHNPPIYECLEKLTEPTIYRSRLNTALSNKDEDDDELHYHPPQAIMMRRVESVSPHAEKVQYASLMKELQRAIVSKKEPSSVTSPQSASESTSEKTQTNSNSSRHESSRSEGKSSDAEFSKELEAALQLIQDLESPNTIETPSEAKSLVEGKDVRPLAVWRNSDASESDKTLSAVGSLAEITSPLTECQPELYTFKPNGKSASVIVRCPDSQSTSGYSSPTHPSNGNTPNWSTTSSINGSNNEIVKPLSYSIHNAKSTTVISLYSPTINPQSKGKSVTLVTISGDNTPILKSTVHNSTFITNTSNNHINKFHITNNTDTQLSNIENSNHTEEIKSTNSPTGTNQSNVWKSLLRKKKQALPKLCPELEGAIIKSESLAYLSEIELLARHERNKEIQREIEARVIQQLGVPRTESNC